MEYSDMWRYLALYMEYFLKSTCDMARFYGGIRQGSISDGARHHFLNSTCDMGCPHQGPLRCVVSQVECRFNRLCSTRLLPLTQLDQ